MASRLLAFWSPGDLVRHGPHTSYACTSQSDDDLVRMWAACDAAARACAPPPLRLPAAVLEGLGRLCEAPWQMAPDFCGKALRPCTGDEGSTGLGLAGWGQRPLPASLPAGGG
jgi:hypothetical protein